MKLKKPVGVEIQRWENVPNHLKSPRDGCFRVTGVGFVQRHITCCHQSFDDRFGHHAFTCL